MIIALVTGKIVINTTMLGIIMDMEMAKMASYIAAGLCMGIGTLGPALGLGFIGGKACESIGKKPEHADSISRNTLIPLVFVESTAVYAFVVSLILLFYVSK